jgi:hypothetical protein
MAVAGMAAVADTGAAEATAGVTAAAEATAAGMAIISPAIRFIKPPGIPGGISNSGRSSQQGNFTRKQLLAGPDGDAERL